MVCIYHIENGDEHDCGRSLMESPWEASPGPRLRLGDVHHVVADGVAAVVAAGVAHHLLLTVGAHF